MFRQSLTLRPLSSARQALSSSPRCAARLLSSAAAAVPRLFTPGPLTTSAGVKAAMQVDLGSRDSRFLRVVAEVRSELLRMGGVASPAYECVLTAGSGTFGVESVLGSALPRTGKLLVGVNGAYGERMLQMARTLGIALAPPVRCHERRAVSAQELLAAAAADPAITHVAVVHHETTSGVLNPVHDIGVGLAALPHAPRFIVDSMSAFGARPRAGAAARALLLPLFLSHAHTHVRPSLRRLPRGPCRLAHPLPSVLLQQVH